MPGQSILHKKLALDPGRFFFSLLSKKRKEEKGRTNEAPYSKLPSTQRNGKGQVNYVPFPVQSRKEPPEEGNHGRLC